MGKNKSIRNIISLACVIGGLLGTIYSTVKAENPKPEVDLDQNVEISVNLEDDSRFMSVDLYRIGEYNGEEFVYLSNYLQLVDKDYYALDTEKEKDASVAVIAKYIKEHPEIKTDFTLKVQGEAKTKELPLGLYLIIQNEGDHNSELRKNIVVEAPLYDEKENIYLYDIPLYPKWDRTIWFSFRPEVVYPLSIVILLGICLLLCLFSTRMVRSLGMTSIFILAGLLGMKIGMTVTMEFIWLMMFFVFFAFMSVGILWMLASIIGGSVKKSVAIDSVKKKMYWIVPVLSGGAGSFIIYNYVSKAWWFYIAIPAGVVLIGEIIQYKRKDKEVVFHTYEDLIELPIMPLESTEDKTEGE